MRAYWNAADLSATTPADPVGLCPGVRPLPVALAIALVLVRPAQQVGVDQRTYVDILVYFRAPSHPKNQRVHARLKLLPLNGSFVAVFRFVQDKLLAPNFPYKNGALLPFTKCYRRQQPFRRFLRYTKSKFIQCRQAD